MPAHAFRRILRDDIGEPQGTRARQFLGVEADDAKLRGRTGSAQRHGDRAPEEARTENGDRLAKCRGVQRTLRNEEQRARGRILDLFAG